jgi:spore coat polysaccharide biosynthesis protein SpsF
MIGCIIQARMGSSRLPGKIMKKINGDTPMLKFQLDQLEFSKNIDQIIIATTTLEPDNLIVDFCKKNNLECFRGESKDVLDRYYKCAKKFNFPIIVRITSDNPLIDPTIVDHVISRFIDSDYDYMSTEVKKSPLGFAVEVFTFKSIKKAWEEAKLPSEHEHVTPYFYNNPDKFKIESVSQEKDLSHIRCTVDTEYDFKLIEKIISKIETRPIHLDHILDLFSKDTNLLEINKHVKHDGYARSLKEDQEFLKRSDS